MDPYFSENESSEASGLCSFSLCSLCSALFALGSRFVVPPRGDYSGKAEREEGAVLRARGIRFASCAWPPFCLGAVARTSCVQNDGLLGRAWHGGGGTSHEQFIGKGCAPRKTFVRGTVRELRIVPTNNVVVYSPEQILKTITHQKNTCTPKEEVLVDY